MDRKIALKWAQALESGKYLQCEGTLRENNKFCCLGVLCNLHAQAHPEIAAAETDPQEYMGHESCLPDAVLEWAGMSDSDGTFHFELKDATAARSLIDLNDEMNYSFSDIAKVIRKHSDQL